MKKLALWCLLLPWFAVAARATRGFACTSVQGANVTSPNVAGAKYLFTSGDCCQYCSQVAGCVAATYVDYLCSPKGSNETVDDPASLTILVTHETPTPAPPTAAPTTGVPPTAPPPTPRPTTVAPTTTAAPLTTHQPTTHQPTTHQPTTAHPTTAAPIATPRPSTPQPSRETPSYLVLVTSCLFSSLCSRQLDMSCKTYADLPGVCYDGQAGADSYRYSVKPSGEGDNGTALFRSSYPSTRCTGHPTAESLPQNTCLSFFGGFRSFLVMRPPNPDLRGCPFVERGVTQLELPSYNTLYVNNGCDLTESTHAQYGASIAVVADSTVVWWRTYASMDCSGDPTASFADAMNVSYTSSNDAGTVVWTCVSLPPAATAAPNVTVVASRSECENSSCQYTLENGCGTTALASEGCRQLEEGGSSEQFTCLNSSVLEQRFNSTDCSGDSYDTLHLTDTCALGDDDKYHKWECLQFSRLRGYPVSRDVCQYVQPTASSCTNSSYITGDCVRDGDHRIIIYCSQSQIWWQVFNSTTCEGDPLSGGIEPTGMWFWSDASQWYVSWNCSTP